MDATTPDVTAEPRAAGEVYTIEIGGRKAWVFQRKPGGNFYVKGNSPVLFQSTGFNTKGLALDVARKKWKAAVTGRFDLLDASKLKKKKACGTIGEAVQAFVLAAEERRVETSEASAGHYAGCLRRLVAWALDLHTNSGLRERIDKAAVDKLPLSMLNEALVDTAVRKYLAPAEKDFLERDRRLRTMHGMFGNALGMVTEAVVRKIYKDLVVPDLKSFREAELPAVMDAEHPTLSDQAVKEMAVAAAIGRSREGFVERPLRLSDPALYLVHLLFRHFGLRNGDVKEARVEWVEILPEPKVVYLPSGQSRKIVAKLCIRRRSYSTPKASSGEIGMSADVLAELQPFLDGKQPMDFLVPAATPTERKELVDRKHADFVRPWVTGHQKKSYELRRWGATLIARLHQSEEMAELFLRHARRTTAQRHYITERPMPAPITLTDCGL